jgi:hypothetical protein
MEHYNVEICRKELVIAPQLSHKQRTLQVGGAEDNLAQRAGWPEGCSGRRHDGIGLTSAKMMLLTGEESLRLAAVAWVTAQSGHLEGTCRL